MSLFIINGKLQRLELTYSRGRDNIDEEDSSLYSDQLVDPNHPGHCLKCSVRYIWGS
jgi:hypothetical protein